MFLRYCTGRIVTDQKDTVYRVYVTDTLRAVAQNTGSYPQKRYIDIVDAPTEDDRTAEDIIAEVTSRGGLEVKHGSI